MKTVNAYYTQALFRFAKDKGVPLGLGTPQPAPELGQARVALQHQDLTWQYLESRLGESLGLDFGLQLQPADMGTFGHLLMSLPTLDDTLARLQRFYPLIGEGGVLKVSCEPDLVTITYTPHYQIARSVRVEAVIASILSVVRHLVEETLSPVCIAFDYTASERIVDQLQREAQCPVNSKANINFIQFATADLAQPLKHANAVVAKSILAILNTELDALSSLTPMEKVERLLAVQPYLSRKQVAERMHISQRTLTRMMGQDAQQFKAVKQRAMQQFAQQQLSKGLTVTNVAEQLHYSDASAFIKAYKQWSGCTPQQYQLELSQ